MIGLLVLGSFSVFANDSFELEVSNDPEIFTSVKQAYSEIPFSTGCLKAKKLAKSSAREKCFSSGYTTCKKIAVLNTQRVRKGLGLGFVGSVGACTFKAIYKGSNE